MNQNNSSCDLAARIGLIAGADVRSESLPGKVYVRHIHMLSTAELRDAIKPSWPNASRLQLLAYYKNRKIEYFHYIDDQPAKKSAD